MSASIRCLTLPISSSNYGLPSLRRTPIVYHIPFAWRKWGFQILPIVLTLATFMERRHPVAIAETPRRQAPYHAHVWECTMRMVEGLPCAWSRGYHAHVRGRTMRMSGGVPCAWSRGYHAHATVSFGWYMGYETRDSMSPIPYI